MAKYLRPMLALGLLTPALVRAAVPPLPPDGRLAYVQEVDQGCVVGVWDSRHPDVQKPVAAAECPEQASLTSKGQVLVLVGDAYVQTYELGSGKLGTPLRLPPEVPQQKTLDKEGLLAGYTPEGALALQARWGHPHPDEYVDKYLYLRQGDAWIVAEHLHCKSYDDPCPFQRRFEATPLTGVWGQGPDEIWNDALAGDPYVVERIPDKFTVRAVEREWDGSDDERPVDYARFNNAIVFHVNGRYSKLEFGAEPGEDSDPFHTFGLRLVGPDNRTLDITDDQFDATIVGHYLMFYGFWDDGWRLYDVGDGKVILDHLVRADWLRE